MRISINGVDNGNGVSTYIEELPHECPFCHKSIRPTPIYGHRHSSIWAVLMNCPSKDCRASFIAYYAQVSEYQSNYTGRTTFGTLNSKQFSDEIVNISISFTRIYNEAFAAEQQGLMEVCGVGYRKALEFLIKDYAIKNHPDEQEKIEKKLLAQCINEYVTDERIKSVAKRAVWLGNDQTHYVRKWEGKNLTDLKKLIDLTLHWVEAEILTESFADEMPD